MAEKEREDALRKELERLNKLDYLHKKLQSKSVLLKTWIAEKKEYLTKTDYGDTLSAVQAKIRRHDAFEQQYSTHQTRLKELHQIIAQIEALGAQNEDVNSTLAIQQDWAELKKLSEQRRAVLTVCLILSGLFYCLYEYITGEASVPTTTGCLVHSVCQESRSMLP